jgi:hypothetical protein
LAEQAALTPKLADLDRQMADLWQKDAADAAAEELARDQQWQSYARELLRVLQPSAGGGYSGNWLDQLDRLGAGIGDMVTFGGTTLFRENVYGEIATRNHQGFCYRLGQVVGFGTSLGLGYLSGPGGAGWAWQAARYYTRAATIYGFGNSTYHLLAGDFRWYHTLGFVPLIGVGARKLVSGAAAKWLAEGHVLLSKPTGGWLVRAFKLRGQLGRPSYELLAWRNKVRFEAHPIRSSWPSWAMYPHMHIDAFGGALQHLHIPIVEPTLIGVGLWWWLSD